jgi:hypothetical protein
MYALNRAVSGLFDLQHQAVVYEQLPALRYALELGQDKPCQRGVISCRQR